MKISNSNRKFVFTQISAPLVGGAVMLLVAFLLREQGYIPGQKELFSSVLFGGFLIFVLVASIIIWGKFLVIVGILSKEEAKGYPFSRPWEKQKSI